MEKSAQTLGGRSTQEMAQRVLYYAKDQVVYRSSSLEKVPTFSSFGLINFVQIAGRSVVHRPLDKAGRSRPYSVSLARQVGSVKVSGGGLKRKGEAHQMRVAYHSTSAVALVQGYRQRIGREKNARSCSKLASTVFPASPYTDKYHQWSGLAYCEVRLLAG